MSGHKQDSMLAIRGGRVIDPAAGRDETADVFVRGGRVVASLDGRPDETVDAGGLVVCPGFVEPHAVAPPAGVGSRWARQALAGGFTTAAVAGVARRDRNFRGPCPKLLTIAPLTVPGTRKLAEMAAAAAAGAVAFSDFPGPHGDAELLRRGLLYAKMLGRPVFDLPRDATLSEGGVAAEGPVAEELGLFAVPATAERVAVRRGIEMAQAEGMTDEGAALAAGGGCRVHFAGLSDAGAAQIVRDYLNDTLLAPAPVSAAVSAAHLLCTAGVLRGFDPAGRVDPPFRGEADRSLLARLAVEGRRVQEYPPAIACLTAGHRPDPGLLDPVDLLAAPPGFEGFETALPAALTACGAGVLPRLVELFTTGPAGVLGLDPPTLEPGSPADVAVFDPAAAWVCDAAELAVPVARTPLAGRALTGRVTHAALGGRVVFDRGRFPAKPAG